MQHMTENSTLQFRPLTMTDLDKLNSEFPQPTPNSHEKRLKKQMDGSVSYIGAELKGVLVGIELIRWKGPQNDNDKKLSQFPEVGSLYTLPEYRGQGIGATISRYTENLVASKGYKGVGAIIKDNNKASIQLHIKNGYARIGEASRTKQHPNLPRSYYVKLFSK